MHNLTHIDTQIIHGQSKNKKIGVISSSISPAVAYSFETAQHASDVVTGKQEGIYYGRYGNPTVSELEQKITMLEGGEATLAVSSGMAAISNALLAYLQQNDHVIITKDIYGGTFSFFKNLAPRFGIQFDYVDCTNLKLIEDAILPETKVIYLETPSNPTLTILDIKSISKIAKRHNLTLIVDNTFMTPYGQQPLELGADVVVHSGTKYLNGHGDVLAGFIISKKDEINRMRKTIMGDLGQNLNAWEAFLILRGLKTLALRMKKHADNAHKIAVFLNDHPRIKKVYYPGLTSHSGHEIAIKQMSSMGGIISFEVEGGYEGGCHFINALNIPLISFSLGDPESLVQHPASMTHSSMPVADRCLYGITDGLIRFSAGLEHPDDLITDIAQALETVTLLSSKN